MRQNGTLCAVLPHYHTRAIKGKSNAIMSKRFSPLLNVVKTVFRIPFRTLRRTGGGQTSLPPPWAVISFRFTRLPRWVDGFLAGGRKAHSAASGGLCTGPRGDATSWVQANRGTAAASYERQAG